MNIADEGSSAHLKAVVHAVPRVAQIDLQAAIWSVNLCFKQFGLPKRIKIDNGHPFVNPHYRDIPTKAKLWWIGLGIQVIQNPPRCPQENGIVEGLQGICYKWTNPKKIQTAKQLQAKLNEISEFQRNHYEMPNRNNQTRIELYPNLNTNKRKYDPHQFNMNLVDNFLSQQVWERRTNQNGVFSFFDHRIYIGRKFKKQEVYITFDPVVRQWMVRNKKGLLLKTSSKAVPMEKEIKNFAIISKNFIGFL